VARSRRYFYESTTRQVEWSRTHRRSARAPFNRSCRWNTCWSVVSGKSCRDRAALRGTCIISSGRRDGMHRRVVLLACFAHFAATAQPRAVAVPYVGCKSDTFVEGPLEAPSGRPKEIRISPAAAQRLAYYEAAVAPGVLGPRGWYCFGYLGSAGATFEISPRPISTDGPDFSAAYSTDHPLRRDLRPLRRRHDHCARFPCAPGLCHAACFRRASPQLFVSLLTLPEGQAFL
jgi:hypothetical protein